MLTALLDRRVMAERYGSGTPQVVALHGWQRSRHDWSATLAGLAALAVDIPGFGVSPPPPEPWSTQEYARQLAPLLDDLDRPVLVGHSFGGRVAIHLAVLAADRIRGLVLTGAPLVDPPGGTGGGGPALGYRAIRALRRAGLVSADRLEAAKQRYGSPDYRQATPLLREVLVRAVNEDYSAPIDALAALGLPVRLVWGELDTAAPLSAARLLATRLGRAGSPAPLTVVQGVGHQLGPELSAAIRTQLDGLLAAPRPTAPPAASPPSVAQPS